MDMDQARDDVRRELDLLPPEIVTIGAELCIRHYETLGKVAPQLLALIKPHALGAVMEVSAQLMDVKDLKVIGRDIILDYLKARGAGPLADALTVMDKGTDDAGSPA